LVEQPIKSVGGFSSFPLLVATSDELASAHASLDHLVSARHQCRGHRHAHRISGLEIDHQLKVGGLFDRDVGDLDAAEELNELSALRLSKDLNDARSVGGKAAFLRHFGKLIDGREAQYCNPVHYKLTVCPKHR
jgi:hypothetical protein